MKKGNKLNTRLLVLSIIMILAVGCGPKCLAAPPIKLIVDGNDITSLAMPIFENDRTLIPVRFIAESVGANVDWKDKERQVLLKRGNTSVVLKIDSHLVQYEENGKISYSLSDVAPKIIGDRTYIPARLVSNALGIGISWNESKRQVIVDSSKISAIEPFFDMKISSIKPGETITGKTDLQVDLKNMDTKKALEIKYLLLDSQTAEGIVINRGSALDSKYTWLPNIEDKGSKVLVAALYNSNKEFIGGDAISVEMKVSPKVELRGIVENQVVDNSVSLLPQLNFVANYVKYEITNLDKNTKNEVLEQEPQDPQGQYSWTPNLEDNGRYSIKLIAYDGENKPYESESVEISIDVPRKLSLSGVKPGQTIDKEVNLLASRNFNVTETQYILRDPSNNKEEVLASLPYGGFTWFPGPEYNGSKDLFVRVKDTRGQSHESEAIKVNLSGAPKLLVSGIGPNQVITSEVKLKSSNNINLDKVSYIAINSKTGKEKILGRDIDGTKEYAIKPETLGEGNWKIRSEAKYKGKDIYSELIPVRIYLGDTFGKQALMEKEEFLDTASNLAKKSWEETGLSAALQTAQAILETGWGQSIGVDKYNGKLSYNLFGVKGEGPAGSVTIRTWEVYNGVRYDVDAKFRAYNDIGESWQGYNDLLLKVERYQPLRDVMYDSRQGAWGLKRSGYATDPKYATKLIKIIKDYNLDLLDRVKI